jgi:hypothetical protein
MASFSWNLVQNSTIFISLVATFVILRLALSKLQHGLQNTVLNSNIANKQLILVFLLHFSVAVAT